MSKKKEKHKFINREISWLAFNDRVLQEAQDMNVPLIERLRFLGIFSNNLDEFFKVRVATLRRATGLSKKPIDPMDFNPEETLRQIHGFVVQQQERFEKTFSQLTADLSRNGIHFVNETGMNAEQKQFAETFFEEKVRPYLVPLMLSHKNIFPSLNDNATYLAIELSYKSKKANPLYALVEIPTSVQRFIELPPQGKKRFVIFLDDVIRYRLRKIFNIFDYDKTEAFAFKVTRDAELDIDDDLSKGLLEKMSRSLSQRKRGQYVRINYDQNMPLNLLDFILKRTKIKEVENIIPGSRYHNKKDLIKLPDFGRRDLCFPPMPTIQHAALKGKTSLLEELKKKDILLHFPYHSFNYIIDLLREAAIDPNVRTIRISIYRVAKNSQIVYALINAAKNGKRVIAVIELQARFDEENNINVMRSLQEAGVRVIPGVQGLKVHCKLIQISRKEGSKTVRYMHVGSGNFHENTASMYSDISLLTSNTEIGREVRKIFEFFESNYQRSIFRHLVISPFNTRRKFTDLINEEIANAEKGKPAWIKIKMNNLVDAGMIEKLYDASNAGVQVDLIIRGICSLIPGIEGRSENIRVISIVGRFLEHSRIISFCNNNNPAYYITSADWMTRNLDHRIEVSCPVYDPSLKKELKTILDIQLSSNAKARVVDNSLKNQYIKLPRGARAIDTQITAYEYFKKPSL
jgi:polyphosphate kinase